MIKGTDLGTVETRREADDLLPLKVFAQHQEDSLGRENQPEESVDNQDEEESVDSDTTGEQSVTRKRAQ